MHLNWFLLEKTSLETVELHTFLVPLEAMHALRELRPETTLDVVVHAKVALHNICEVSHNFIRVLVQEALQLAHLLVVVEVFLVFSVEFDEDVFKVL